MGSRTLWCWGVQREPGSVPLSGTWPVAATEFRIYLPRKREDSGRTLPDDDMSKDGFQVLEKDTPELCGVQAHLKGTEKDSQL